MKEVAEETRYGVAAVDRTVLILNVLDREQDALRLAEVARRTGLSEPTVLRYLATLCRHELAEKDNLGRYRLGIALFRLGYRALGVSDPRNVALPYMERLLEKFEETVNFGMRHGDKLVLIEVLESPRSIRKGATIGEEDIWHASALGKAILAHLPEIEARGILSRRGYGGFTEHTLTSFAALDKALDDVRRLGYATDDDEFEEGLRCVGAPVFDQRGRPSYAISVSAPASRLPHDLIGLVGQEVAAAAAAISGGIGYVARDRDA